MKKVLLTILLTTSIFGFELNWINDYDKALALAKKEVKDVYLFIGADKCPYCERFKEKTLSKQYVMDAINKDFVPVYLSRDQHKIPEKFEKFGVPRHYFLDPKGEVFDEDLGFLDPKTFMNYLEEIRMYQN